MSKYPSLAHGGIPAGLPRDAVPSARSGTQNQLLVAGGVAWEGEPAMCVDTLKSNGWPCPNKAMSNSDVCSGHAKAREKQQKGS